MSKVVAAPERNILWSGTPGAVRMARATSRRLIAASIDRVFALAIQAERLPEWNPSFLALRNVSGPLDISAAYFDAQTVVAGHPLDSHHLVTSVSPPRRLVLAGVTREDGRLTWTRRYTPVDDTGTEEITEVEYLLPAGVVSLPASSASPQREIEHAVIRSVEGFAAPAESTVDSVT